MKILVAPLVMLVFLSGCASTKISSFVDPEYESEQYSRPIVWGKIAPLEDRKKLEDGIVEKFKRKGINAINGVKVFPPTRKITNEFMAAALEKSDGDSLFIIKLKEGSSIYRMEYEATLYGNKLHKVWIGSVVTKLRQNGFSDSQGNDAVFESTAQEIVNQIVNDGVVSSKVVNKQDEFSVLFSSIVYSGVSSDSCSKISSMAEKIMESRQDGIPVEKIIDISDNKIYKGMVLKAYEIQRYKEVVSQTKSIKNYKDKIYEACIAPKG